MFDFLKFTEARSDFSYERKCPKSANPSSSKAKQMGNIMRIHSFCFGEESMFEANQKNVVPIILQSRGDFGSTENPLF